MSFRFGYLLSVALVAALLTPPPTALAGPAAGVPAFLVDRPGQAVELRGTRSRAIAFFVADDGTLELTVLLSGGALGSEVLKSRVKLADGQSHAFSLAGGAPGAAAERFVFKRMGKSVSMGVERDAAPGKPESGGSAADR